MLITSFYVKMLCKSQLLHKFDILVALNIYSCVSAPRGVLCMWMHRALVIVLCITCKQVRK